jgi:hypothetical protein
MSESCECDSYVAALPEGSGGQIGPDRSHALPADHEPCVRQRVPSLNTFAVITSDSQSMAARIGVHPQPNESAVA